MHISCSAMCLAYIDHLGILNAFGLLDDLLYIITISDIPQSDIAILTSSEHEGVNDVELSRSRLRSRRK